MEIFDKLVLPISGNNLQVLNYLLMLAEMIFLTYAGILFGSVFMSFIYNKKSKKRDYAINSRLARDYVEIITSSAAFPWGLGIFPFLAIIFMYQQLLYQAGVPVAWYLSISFILFLVSLWLIQMYKFSLNLKSILGFGLKSKDLDKEDINYHDMVDFKESSEKVNSATAVWSLFALFASMLMFSASTSLAIDRSRWAESTYAFYLIFNEDTFIRLLHFISAAFAMTGVAFITKVFLWDKETVINEEYDRIAKNLNGGMAIVFILIQPLFLAVSLYFTPGYAISNIMFLLTFIAVIFVFVISHYIYKMIKERNFAQINIAFFLTLVLFSIIFIKEQSAFTYSNKDHIEKLSMNYDTLTAKELAATGRTDEVKISGEEIYKTKCLACHEFDKKKVGPSHKSVLPKYIDNKKALAEFILNPKKVNPDFPAMPSQGLSPKEAEAVADYMITHYKPMLK
jgi:cytochrome c